MKNRCPWCGTDPLYIEYHDTEWGVPVYDDKRFFEFLVLETFQAGLSWITILKKREYFREAFDDFNYKKIAAYKAPKISALLANKGIVRNKLKVHATVTNAIAYMKVQEEFGSFSHYIWKFVNNTPIQNPFKTLEEVPANTALSEQISKDLKKRGFKFVGSTVVYAFMQATGLVNDHITSCYRHSKLSI